MRFPFWKEPSEAMRAWMETDETWYEDQDSLTTIGDDLISATRFADEMAAKRYGVNMEEKKDNVLQFPGPKKKEVRLAGIIEDVPILHCHCACQLFIITPMGIFCSECGCCVASVSGYPT